MVCAKCGAVIQSKDCFCEGCGTPLGSGPEALPVTETVGDPCLCTTFDADDFCVECGQKKSTLEAALVEIIDDALACASHRGRWHSENQDAVAVRRLEGGVVVMVVSDGVSSADHSREASRIAADTVMEQVSANLQGDLGEALRGAIALADDRLKAMPYMDMQKAEPEATLVAAIVRGRQVHFAWVGDSRIYTIHRGEVRQLSEDDSWLNEALRSGMPREVAEQDHKAHCITQCLGMRDAAPDINVGSAELEPGCWVVLCSDGLWNYFNEGDALVACAPTPCFGGPAAELCKALVDAANTCGGRDNITVATLRLEA